MNSLLARDEAKRAQSLRKGRLRVGWSDERVAQYTLAQAGLCAICGTTMRTPHADHDHVKGHPRGLLCQLCNTGLGNFRDDPSLLLAALAYLGRWGLVDELLEVSA